jgi:ParB-like chromosome segregation protein Spo0J
MGLIPKLMLGDSMSKVPNQPVGPASLPSGADAVPSAKGHPDPGSPAVKKKTLLDNLRPSPQIEALWAGTTTAEEDAALEAFVTATGPVLPIIADEQGNIIDGHRCYRIYQKLNIKEVFVTILKDLTDEQKRHLAVSLNVHRRHLTVDQKKEIARRLLKENPRLSARYLGRLVGVAHRTAQDVKTAMIAGGEIPHLDEIEGQDGKTYKAKGATTTLLDFKMTVSHLAKVKDLPGVVTHRKVRNQIAKERRQEAARKGSEMADPANIRLLHCDFRDLLAREPGIERAAGLVLTDYPYEEPFMPLLPDLAAFAKRLLMPGGWFVTFAGQGQLARVIAALSAELRYVWTISVTLRAGRELCPLWRREYLPALASRALVPQRQPGKLPDRHEYRRPIRPKKAGEGLAPLAAELGGHPHARPELQPCG